MFYVFSCQWNDSVIKTAHSVRFTGNSLLFCNGSSYFQDLLGFVLLKIFNAWYFNKQIQFFLNLYNGHLV